MNKRQIFLVLLFTLLFTTPALAWFGATKYYITYPNLSQDINYTNITSYVTYNVTNVTNITNTTVNNITNITNVTNITNNYFGGNTSWNESYADTLYYPRSSNPAGYLTTFTEVDPVWNVSATNYYLKWYVYNKTEAYNKSEVYNKTESDGKYYLLTNPNNYINTSNLSAVYANISELNHSLHYLNLTVLALNVSNNSLYVLVGSLNSTLISTNSSLQYLNSVVANLALNNSLLNTSLQSTNNSLVYLNGVVGNLAGNVSSMNTQLVATNATATLTYSYLYSIFYNLSSLNSSLLTTQGVLGNLAYNVSTLGNWSADKYNYYTKTDVYNKSETFNQTEILDLIPSSLTLYFYDALDATNASQRVMNRTQNLAESNVTTSGIVNGQHLVWRRSQDLNITQISQGLIHTHTTVYKVSGVKDIRIYGQVYVNYTNGSTILIATTDTTPMLITGVRTNIILQSQINQTALSASDRLIWTLVATVSGGGTDPSVAVIIGGTSNNGLDLPVSVSNFVEADPYFIAAKDAIYQNISLLQTANSSLNTTLGNTNSVISSLITNHSSTNATASTRAGIGTCPAGTVVGNTTFNGVQCLTVSSSTSVSSFNYYGATLYNYSSNVSSFKNTSNQNMVTVFKCPDNMRCLLKDYVYYWDNPSGTAAISLYTNISGTLYRLTTSINAAARSITRSSSLLGYVMEANEELIFVQTSGAATLYNVSGSYSYLQFSNLSNLRSPRIYNITSNPYTFFYQSTTGKGSIVLDQLGQPFGATPLLLYTRNDSLSSAFNYAFVTNNNATPTLNDVISYNNTDANNAKNQNTITSFLSYNQSIYFNTSISTTRSMLYATVIELS